MSSHFRESAFALLLATTIACSSSEGGNDPSPGGTAGTGGTAAGTGGTAGKGGGSGGAAAGSGGAAAGSGGSSAGTGGMGAFPASYGLLEAEWSVVNGATGEPFARCEDVLVDLFRITLRNYADGTGWDLDASCFLGKATIGAPPGMWDIRGLLVTRDDVRLAGLGIGRSGLTEVRPGETIVLDPFVFEMYLHRLTWTVSKAGTPSTCEAVGASQVKISWLNESALSVIKPCSAGTTDLLVFQGMRTLLDAELLDSSGRALATWELRPWELAGSGDQPPPIIVLDVP